MTREFEAEVLRRLEKIDGTLEVYCPQVTEARTKAEMAYQFSLGSSIASIGAIIKSFFGG